LLRANEMAALDADTRALFVRCGLEGSLKTIESSAALGENLRRTLVEAGVADSGCAKHVGAHLLNITTGLAGHPEGRAVVARFIADGRLATAAQVTAAVAWVKANMKEGFTGSPDIGALEKACGVGVSFTDEQIQARVSERAGWGVGGGEGVHGADSHALLAAKCIVHPAAAFCFLPRPCLPVCGRASTG